MKKILALLVTIILGFSSFAQSDNAIYRIEAKMYNVEQNLESFGLTAEEFAKVVGSPYENETFLPGSIFRGDKLLTKDMLLRYNAFSDEIEMQKSSTSETKKYSALIKDPDIFVKIYNEVYLFIPLDGSQEKGRYFKVILDDPKYDLYKKMEVEYKAPTPAKTSYDKERPAKFTKKDTYYLVSPDGKFYELPDSKSKIIKVMSNKEGEIKTFIKKNRLDLGDEKDLSKLIKYYNSLL